MTEQPVSIIETISRAVARLADAAEAHGEVRARAGTWHPRWTETLTERNAAGVALMKLIQAHITQPDAPITK